MTSSTFVYYLSELLIIIVINFVMSTVTRSTDYSIGYAYYLKLLLIKL